MVLLLVVIPVKIRGDLKMLHKCRHPVETQTVEDLALRRNVVLGDTLQTQTREGVEIIILD